MTRRPTVVVKVTQDARVIHTFAFNQDQITVGREPGMDIALPSSDVSRTHCTLEFVEGRFQVRDLGSKNGTLLNDRRVVNHAIESGDNVRVGDFKLWLQFVACAQELEQKTAAACEAPTLERSAPQRAEPPRNQAV